MAAHELLTGRARDSREVERARFARELRVDHDVEQEIAELLAQRRGIAGVDGVHRLVDLFEQERAKAGMGLLAVPGAALRRAQPLRDLCEELERASDVRRPAGREALEQRVANRTRSRAGAASRRARASPAPASSRTRSP